MSSASQALLEAARLLTGADPKLYRIVLLSLQVSLTAVAISSMVGLIVGATIAVSRSHLLFMRPHR